MVQKLDSDFVLNKKWEEGELHPQIVCQSKQRTVIKMSKKKSIMILESVSPLELKWSSLSHQFEEETCTHLKKLGVFTRIFIEILMRYEL